MTNRYRITNTETGNQYVITDETLAERGCTLAEWLVRKINAYGQTPTVVVEDATSEIVAQKIDEAWKTADTLGKELDENSRNSVLWMYFDPTSSEERKNRILAVQAWWSNLWAYYATVKAGIQTDPDFAYDFEAIVGHCPWTIWEIASA